MGFTNTFSSNANPGRGNNSLPFGAGSSVYPGKQGPSALGQSNTFGPWGQSNGGISFPFNPVMPQMPKWMPNFNAMGGELAGMMGSTAKAYDTSEYDTAFENEKGNLLTQANQSANAAGQEYMNRARQSGGATEGAGLIKAEGQVAGRRAVAEMELNKAQYDEASKRAASQQEFQIADSLGKLRDSYLNSLIGFMGPGYQSYWNTLNKRADMAVTYS